MKLNTYNEIIAEMHKRTSTDCMTIIRTKFHSVPESTLRSIVSQEYQRKMKSTHWKHHSPETTKQYYEEYLSLMKNTNSVDCCIRLAEKYDLSPSLMARIILEKHLSTVAECTPSKKEISSLLKNTCLITDKALSANVHMCVLFDDYYGPIWDVVRHSIGQQYEFKLKQHLQNLNIPYFAEEQLRVQGYDKTPDVKLEIPFAINGRVINWIESKASFGDVESHKTNLKEQFWSYWNRFGPGLVIYWFGFIDELDVNGEKGILLRDCFPEDITFMNPERVVDVS